MKKQIKTIALITTGLVVGVVVARNDMRTYSLKNDENNIQLISGRKSALLSMQNVNEIKKYFLIRD
ncbi:hypothetical protein [Globicatella sp. PHS-GS-PNBC-21-1553]|uniref:hypothetical protein n=1 Tax=Globicatella sp. PHS-GS-PNBC-21-1553 TaxID=2885764 RepID=UPI00298F17C3|nr:hypothetical protein [Globicatella sp. PHS-GS-PNBC-21-1553]WPC07977.1 hypothetical protein LB888_07935 [Globicatella sp. PHS-GS-PNBC-21-1553]